MIVVVLCVITDKQNSIILAYFNEMSDLLHIFLCDI